ncbi:peptidoglycan-recognition protein 2-like [Neocloeon triangulifer]|uniref:peptidoglycan-recognition protein 2-like n=1 Tax=Neocloeon triangulifer TaxID=2078957 RepID=UPI00286F742C|nr:peptidoglycan-recognition protein 2-like [Neocloeon triangulifer]
MKITIVIALAACFSSVFAACPTIVSRADWGARPPYSVSYQPLPIPYVVIHHAESQTCNDFDTCAAMVRGFQDEHMDVNGWSDIGYNFLVGEDGRVYEGRGWQAIGSHTPGFNSLSIGVCFIGTFSAYLPYPVALDAAKLLNECGIEQGYLFPDFGLIGHRQAFVTSSCPGDALYNEITTWPNFEPNP